MTYEIAGAGGNAVRSLSLGRGLASLGHDVTLMVAAASRALVPSVQEIDGVTVFSSAGVLPRRIRHAGFDPLDAVQRWRYGRHARFDVIHGFAHRPTVTLVARNARRRWGVPYIADWADLFGNAGIGGLRTGGSKLISALDHRMEPNAYTRADGVTVICRDLGERTIALGVPRSRIHLLPVGANVDAIRPLDSIAMRRKHGIPLDAKVAAFVGVNTYDNALLAETFIQVASRRPDALMLLIGTPMPEFDALVSAAGLSDRVIRRGFVPFDRLEEHLACADVMLLPYTNRPLNVARYPNKIGDYMAAGRPTVTNPTGDLRSLVEEEGVGVLVPEDATDFATAVIELFENTGLAKRIGERARAVAESAYSWRELARGLASFYVACGARNRISS